MCIGVHRRASAVAVDLKIQEAPLLLRAHPSPRSGQVNLDVHRRSSACIGGCSGFKD
jgi:hypothetical protein